MSLCLTLWLTEGVSIYSLLVMVSSCIGMSNYDEYKIELIMANPDIIHRLQVQEIEPNMRRSVSCDFLNSVIIHNYKSIVDNSCVYRQMMY